MKRLSEKLNLLTKTGGFTLIELLIVIVIIGILAGVLIAVIDPAAQQNRARDANVKAQLNKVALATQGYISAYGAAPNDIQFFGSIDNATDVGGNSCTGAGGGAGDNVCVFDIQGNAWTLQECAADMTRGNAACHYYYERDPQSNGLPEFVLRADSFGIDATYFELRNYTAGGLSASTILHCTSGGCVTP